MSSSARRPYRLTPHCENLQRAGHTGRLRVAPLPDLGICRMRFALRDECPCETVAPEVLGLVQGYVSAADQHGNAFTGLPQSRADRAGDVVRGCHPQSLEYVFGIRPGAAGENGEELVSSEARERVSEPYQRSPGSG